LDDINRKWASPIIQWLTSESNPKIGHDIKKMIFMLRQADLDLKGIYDDTMLSSYLLNPAFSDPSLPDASEKWLDIHLGQIPYTLAQKIENIPYEDIAECACAVYRLSGILQNEIKKNHLDELYRDIEIPLLSVLADMESEGVSIDCELLSKMKSKMQDKLAEIEGRLYKIAGASFNLNSPKQLSEILFTKLKLPVIKKTKTGASTDSEVLQKLSSLHEFPRQLIEYRELSKLVSTYVEALPQLVNPKTKRVHTTFHQAKTATGRLSSSNPNLQNIPIRTDIGRQIRKAFIPGESGWVLLASDYSQIELRILAHLSKDPALIEAFRKEHDIHRYTASLIYGVDENDVTPEMRNSMKEINYGIIYGMSAFGLSKQLGISNEEAASFIQSYFARYKSVQPFFEEQIKKAKEEGFVQTILGRRRYIPELKSPDQAIRQFGERMAINAPLQGSAADLIKVAMIKLAEKLKKAKISGKMILQVHDELVFESSPKYLKELALLVRDAMENALEMSVPIRVSLKSGPNWLDLSKMD
jgi:DNA polymerase-1